MKCVHINKTQKLRQAKSSTMLKTLSLLPRSVKSTKFLQTKKEKKKKTLSNRVKNRNISEIPPTVIEIQNHGFTSIRWKCGKTVSYTVTPDSHQDQHTQVTQHIETPNLTDIHHQITNKYKIRQQIIIQSSQS